jgi:ribose-phosphate pyrophosphokinase
MIKISSPDCFRQELHYESFVFNGGEVSVKLDSRNIDFIDSAKRITIEARLVNSDEFFKLALIKNALEKLVKSKTEIHLFAPYFPYARQDRVCDTGEAFSLKVYADLINSLNFETVTIYDPHSEVTPALINNCKVIDQKSIVKTFGNFLNVVFKPNTIFCSPDAGSNKKTSEVAAYANHSSFIRADKLRDLSNGQIKETIVYADSLEGMNVIICDDICDGGRTFIELAKALKQKKANKVFLYVTHGIFSQGILSLISAGIDGIFTTNSFQDFDEAFKKANVLEVLDIFTLMRCQTR